MKKYEKGQSLVLLLIFVLMAMTFAITAILTTIVNSGSVTTMQRGIEVRELADSGVENALLELIRDPSYAGEDYLLDGVDISTSITEGLQKTITVEATESDITRTVEVLIDYTDNVLSVVSWKEIYN